MFIAKVNYISFYNICDIKNRIGKLGAPLSQMGEVRPFLDGNYTQRFEPRAVTTPLIYSTELGQTIVFFK